MEFDHVNLRYKNAGADSLSDITFTAAKGETIGIIGGTGSGKSSLVNLIPRFYDAASGEVKVGGVNVKDMDVEQLREKIGVVPQKAVLFHGTIRENMQWGVTNASDDEIMEATEAAQGLDVIKAKGGLDCEIEQGGKNLSGGQRQRAVIARALVVNPKLLLADEPISALDVSLQAQIINLLMDLQSELNLSILLVAHDLAVVRQIADEILIMYLGHIVERAKSKDIYSDARHPYTKVLLKAAPSIKKGINDEGFSLDLKVGDTPSPENPPKGCPFCTRCIYADDECMEKCPENVEVSPGHFVMCSKFCG